VAQPCLWLVTEILQAHQENGMPELHFQAKVSQLKNKVQHLLMGWLLRDGLLPLYQTNIL
jgi:hypothetical protein